MAIELHQLRYAVLAANTQSFSRAAATFCVKQSTLSRRVLQLEGRLGVKLFERTTRGAEPTANGRVFIEQARRTVTDVDKLQTTARKPRAETMQAFFNDYPEWRTAEVPADGFSWKWYYAFQHLGDLAATPQAQACRAGLESRDRWAGRAAVLLPAAGLQTILHRLARTDLRASLIYQDRIRTFHERLRRFYYVYVFERQRFGIRDFGRVPRWGGEASEIGRSQ